MSIALGLGLGVPFMQGFGASYYKEGLVLDYSTEVGPFQIIDQSDFGNLGTLYTGRYISTDGVTDFIDFGDVSSYVVDSLTLIRFRVRPATTSVSISIRDGISDTVDNLIPNVWQWAELETLLTVDFLRLGADSYGSANSAADWSDLTVTDAFIEGDAGGHWTLADHADLLDAGLDGLTVADSGANQLHGTCDGCNGATGEGIDPEVAGIVGLDDKMYFDGVDDYVSTDIPLWDGSDFDLTTYIQVSSTASERAPLGNVGGSGAHTLVLLVNGGFNLFFGGVTDGVDAIRNAAIGTFTAGKLYKLHIVKTGNNFVISVDDVEIIDQTLSAPVTSANLLALGVYRTVSPLSYLDGLFASLSVDIGGSTETWDGTESGATSNGWTVNGTPALYTGQPFDGFVSTWYDQTDPTIALYNSARYFNGVDTNVDLDSEVVMAGDFSITMTHLYSPTGASQQILSKTGSADDRFGFSSGSNAYYFSTSSGADIFTGAIPNEGENTISLSRTGTTVTLTLNGSDYTTTESGSFTVSRIGTLGTSTSSAVKGSVFNININGVAAYTGLGTSVTAWEDTIGSNDGTETNGAAYTGQGVGNHATQGTTTAQPKIVDAGALVVDSNGHAQIEFDGVDDILDSTKPFSSTFSWFSLVNSIGTGDIAYHGNPSSDGYGLIRKGSDSKNSVLFGGVAAYTGTTLTQDAIRSMIGNTTSPDLFLNGVDESLSGAGSAVTPPTNGLTIGGAVGSSSQVSCRELIFYDTDQSASRVAIEANINAAYTIF